MKTAGREEDRIRRDFSARLNSALDDMGVPMKDKGRQVVTGRLFGVSQKGARKWLEGEGLPRPKNMMKLAAKLNVRQEWLMFGLGPKRELPHSKQKFFTDQKSQLLLAVEKALVKADMTPTEKQKVTFFASLYEYLSSQEKE